MNKLFINLKKILLNKINLAYIFVIIFLIGYFVTSFIISTKKYQEIYIDQKYHEQELAVASSANAISIFLDLAKNSLLLLSRNESIISQDSLIQYNLDNYSSDWENTPIIAVARFNRLGTLQHFSNNTDIEVSDTVEDLSISDTEFFTWAKTADVGDVYIGKPRLPRIKTADFQFIIPLITPIRKQGIFDGVLAIAISLPKLTTAYLDPLYITPNSRAYLIHSDSTIIATISGDEQLVGVNYFEYLRDNPYPESEKAIKSLTKAINDEKPGRLDAILFSTSRMKLVRFLISYSPVIFQNTHWTIGIAVPIDDINSGLTPIKEGSVMYIFLFISVLIILSFTGTLITKIIKSQYKK